MTSQELDISAYLTASSDKSCTNPDYNTEKTRIGTLTALSMFAKSISYGPVRFVSQGATHQEMSEQGCKKARYQNHFSICQ